MSDTMSAGKHLGDAGDPDETTALTPVPEPLAEEPTIVVAAPALAAAAAWFAPLPPSPVSSAVPVMVSPALAMRSATTVTSTLMLPTTMTLMATSLGATTSCRRAARTQPAAVASDACSASGDRSRRP